MILTIIVPCYNEVATIQATIEAILRLGDALAPFENTLDIIVIDDASSDGTLTVLQRLAAKYSVVRVIAHDCNRGKGSAIQTAQAHARGEIIVIQDADLEYDPADIPVLIHPIQQGHADAVLGTRFGGSGAHRVLYYWHRVGNGFVTLLSNMFTNLNLTDMEVGYKAFTRDAFTCMHLTRTRFGIEPEIVARLSQMGARIYEVPISYYGRTYAEGKKITWRDGIAALWHIVYARLTAHAQAPLPKPVAFPAVSETDSSQSLKRFA